MSETFVRLREQLNRPPSGEQFKTLQALLYGISDREQRDMAMEYVQQHFSYLSRKPEPEPLMWGDYQVLSKAPEENSFFYGLHCCLGTHDVDDPTPRVVQLHYPKTAESGADGLAFSAQMVRILFQAHTTLSTPYGPKAQLVVLQGLALIAVEQQESVTLEEIRRYLRQSPISPEQRCVLTAVCGVMIARALHTAHQTTLDGVRINLIQRSLSPAHVLVLEDGSVQLLGAEPARHFTVMQERLRNERMLWMSPEIIVGSSDIGPGSDIYALGVILYNMLVDEHPFERETPLDSLRATLEEQAPLLHQREPQIPRALSDIVAQAMARELTDRFTQAEDLAQALEGWLLQVGVIDPAGWLVDFVQQELQPSLFFMRQLHLLADLDDVPTGPFAPLSEAEIAALLRIHSEPLVPPEELEPLAEPPSRSFWDPRRWFGL